MTIFDARLLAPAWLTVAVASSKDRGRPALDRTVSIEQYHQGARISATDSYLLLTAWVPTPDFEYDEPPAIDEAPYATAVAMDPHGRARGLLGHCLGLVAAAHKAMPEDPEPVLLRLELGVVDQVDEDERSSFAGFDIPWVVLELPDRERVKLRTYEGEYPNWRPVLASHTSRRTAAVALSAGRLEQLAKVSKYHDDRAMRFGFGGANRGVHVDIEGEPIEGLVMPIRWDFDTDEPRDDTPAAPEDEAAA